MIHTTSIISNVREKFFKQSVTIYSKSSFASFCKITCKYSDIKVVVWIVGAVILIAGVGLVWFYSAYPAVGPAPEVDVKESPSQIERGKYLANHVTLCVDCHSTRDWSTFAGPIVPGTEGQGGEKFGPKLGFAGTFYSKNITPHNLKNWTDGEI